MTTQSDKCPQCSRTWHGEVPFPIWACAHPWHAGHTQTEAAAVKWECKQGHKYDCGFVYGRDCTCGWTAYCHRKWEAREAKRNEDVALSVLNATKESSNERLNAAASDLLDALEDALFLLYGDEGEMSEYETAIRKAEAAIAKARGDKNER